MLSKLISINYKKSAGNFFAFCIGLFIAGLLIFATDRYIYFHPLQFNKPEKVVEPADLPMAPVSSFDLNLLQKTVNEEKEKYKLLTGTRVQPMDEQLISKEGNSIQKQTLKTTAGEIVFDVEYELDKANRRVTPGQDQQGSEVTLVFLGDSLTFGQGVRSDETLPAQFTKFFKKISIRNLGIRGGGPANAYYWLQNDERFSEFPTQNVILIYTALDFHFRRMICTTRCYAPENAWMLKNPKYTMAEGDVVYEGLFKDTFPEKYLISFFPYFLSLTKGPLEFPDPYSKRFVDMHNLFLNKIRSKISEKYNIVDFYQIPMSISPFFTKLIAENPSPSAKNIFFPWRELYQILDIRGNQLHIPFDLHPTPAAHMMEAQAIKYQLLKDHPDIFKSLER